MCLSSNGYKLVYRPSHPKAATGGNVYEHILVAEKALGKPLPKGAEVHHYGKKTDNTKLVICQDRAYHMLLHQRMRALKACGHASWRKCGICKQYDKPENLYIYKKIAYHEACQVVYGRAYREKNKAKKVAYRKEYYRKNKK